MAEFDPIELIKSLNKRGIRYLLIGRQAVVQYGGPLFSFDYDFWVHPDDRDNAYGILEDFGLTGKYNASDGRPLDSFFDDKGNKVAAFFVKIMSKEDIEVVFDEVYARAVIKADPDSGFFVRIPPVDDLINLKRMGEMRPKDYEDIEYLQTLKDMDD